MMRTPHTPRRVDTARWQALGQVVEEVLHVTDPIALRQILGDLIIGAIGTYPLDATDLQDALAHLHATGGEGPRSGAAPPVPEADDAGGATESWEQLELGYASRRTWEHMTQ